MSFSNDSTINKRQTFSGYIPTSLKYLLFGNSRTQINAHASTYYNHVMFLGKNLERLNTARLESQIFNSRPYKQPTQRPFVLIWGPKQNVEQTHNTDIKNGSHNIYSQYTYLFLLYSNIKWSTNTIPILCRQLNQLIP